MHPTGQHLGLLQGPAITPHIPLPFLKPFRTLPLFCLFLMAYL